MYTFNFRSIGVVKVHRQGCESFELFDQLNPVIMKLNIKNMYSQDCLMLVKEELTKLGLNYVRVELGSAEFVERISPDQIRQLNPALSGAGLELPEYKKMGLV